MTDHLGDSGGTEQLPAVQSPPLGWLPGLLTLEATLIEQPLLVAWAPVGWVYPSGLGVSFQVLRTRSTPASTGRPGAPQVTFAVSHDDHGAILDPDHRDRHHEDGWAAVAARTAWSEERSDYFIWISPLPATAARLEVLAEVAGEPASSRPLTLAAELLAAAAARARRINLNDDQHIGIGFFR